MKKVGLVFLSFVLMFALSGAGYSDEYLATCKSNCAKRGKKESCVKRCECRKKCYESKGVLGKVCKNLSGAAQQKCRADKKACRVQCS